MFFVIGLILATAIALGLVVALRRFAARENPTIITFPPAQRHALVTTKSVSPEKVKSNDKTEEQGNVVDVVHAIPGKWLDKSGDDPWNWCYKDEDEEHKEPRGLLYVLFGIAFIGFFRYLRLNEVRTFRWGRKEEETEYHMLSKSSLTRFPFFSGQHDIRLKGIETKQILKVDLLLNIIFEETYPVRVRLRTADPYAVLTMMVSKLTISLIGGHDAKDIVQKKELQDDLARDIENAVKKSVVEELGITIKKVTLAEIDFEEETKKLLELEAKTDLENRARLALADNYKETEIRKAEGDRQARILRNEGDAHRVEHVIKPVVGLGELGVQVRQAEAYETNKTMTTLVVGQGATPVVPVGAK